MTKSIKHIQDPRTAPHAPSQNRYARWRAGTLILVYVLMAVHIVHWTLAGKTVAPFELNEVMYTLEYGIVTAGFLFMLGVTIATAVFGRVFCSWGCHILALQDFSAWILRKLRIKPRAVRSRVLLWVPVMAALYMFAWPQALRLIRGNPLPQLHLRTDAEGWASFATENFWRNLPGPIIITLTFGVCGFLIVYVLGSRGFCTYGCPYGAIFRLAERVAPARIRLRGNDCLACGSCTAACTSHVRVHEELNRYGMVINPACMRDMDCVSACPKQNVYYGFGLPPVLKTIRNDTPIRTTYDFTGWEEALQVVVFMVLLFVFRGLYDQVPFLLSLALGAIGAYLAVVCVRLVKRPALQLNRWQLKIDGRLTHRGRLFTSTMVKFLLFTLHSGFVHYHAFQGHRLTAWALGSNPIDEPVARRALHHLDTAHQWGLIPTTRIPTALADVHYQLAGLSFKTNRIEDAERHLRATLQVGPRHYMAHYDLGALLMNQNHREAAVEHLRRATELKPDFADGHYNLALALWMSGDRDSAREEINTALALNPTDHQTIELRILMGETLRP